MIAGFDILYIGAKGFTSLARAKKVLIRSRGKKGKWVTLVFTKRHRLKSQKEFALYALLKKLSYSRDLKKPKKPKKPKQVIKTKKKREKAPKGPIVPPEPSAVEKLIQQRAPELASKIKFKKPTVTRKTIKTREGKYISIEKFDYELTKDINFSKGREYETPVVNEFIQAVKAEFRKLYKKFGRKDYLVRIHHQYKNFINYYDAYPQDLPKGMTKKDVEDKGFGGFSLNRQTFYNNAQIDDQFDYILAPKYLTSFSRYLNFSNPSTEFNFSGFMIEVTVSVLTESEIKARTELRLKKLKKKKKG